jgi:hypothetical protein
MWESIEELGSGIFVYRNNIKTELNIPDRLENLLGTSDSQDPYRWMPAYVGYQQLMPEYRDCNDFKFKKTDIADDTSDKSIA